MINMPVSQNSEPSAPSVGTAGAVLKCIDNKTLCGNSNTDDSPSLRTNVKNADKTQSQDENECVRTQGSNASPSAKDVDNNSRHVAQKEPICTEKPVTSNISRKFSEVKSDEANIKRQGDANVDLKFEKPLASNELETSNDTMMQSDKKRLENRTKETACVTSNETFIVSKPRRVLLSSINPHIICHLCKGYLIDATTIVECLHSFCHSCLIKHLRMEQYCPRCEMMINTAKPNIKPDTTLQAIVYKLVPGLYERELMRKRAFYKDRPDEAALATPEQRGDDTEHLIFSPSDYMSLSLEYADIKEHVGANSDYVELLKPRYLRCPAMYTVGLLKKFVHGKFEIDPHRFTVDIMYKVKTIVLLDHYTLMDIAYIYTWKRDAPMRFYFRVKRSSIPYVKPKRYPAPVIAIETPNAVPLNVPVPDTIVVVKEETSSSSNQEEFDNEAKPSHASETGAITVVHEFNPPGLSSNDTLLPIQDIKVEDETDLIPVSRIPKTLKNNGPLLDDSNIAGSRNEANVADGDKLEQIKLSKRVDRRSVNGIGFVHANIPKEKSSKNSQHTSPSSVGKGERKVENIKLKIDLSKQNSVTIINMSDPQRKEVTKLVKPDKEWKVKNKKERDSRAKCSPNSERKSKTPSPLTVPPITIKAEQISPVGKIMDSQPTIGKLTEACSMNSEEEKKSEFLMSFALTPIKTIKLEKSDKPEPRTIVSCSTRLAGESSIATIPRDPLQTPINASIKTAVASKRKSKEPIKTVVKRPKLSPPLSPNDFKIRLPPTAKSNAIIDKSLMPPPILVPSSSTASATSSATKLPVMRPPAGMPPKKLQKSANKVPLSCSLSPHPVQRIHIAAPGNRTPIAKRYQPILPKAVRPNPFANIPSDVNKILKDAGTEIKSVASNAKTSKVYGPKTLVPAKESTLMGPPPAPLSKIQGQSTVTARNATSKAINNNKVNNCNNYFNLALYNATKSKGNEAPPGCRTPMYSPNSPIYSPNSPQYVPNYTIPPVPTYKYTPKPPSESSGSYLQSVLESNSQLAGLFPAPPIRKESPKSSISDSVSPNNTTTNKSDSLQKRVYPFARSPSPIEDPPEKQLKVKSLLTSCNINIPSSLSITITREDGESQLNNQTYPKHKNPVNNYIEILKLPDQTVENECSKRASTSTQRTTTVASNSVPSMLKVENADLKCESISNFKTQQHQVVQKKPASPSSLITQRPELGSRNGDKLGSSMPNCNSKTANVGQKSSPDVQKKTQNTGTSGGVAKVEQPHQQSEQLKQAMAIQSIASDKKTPSPEKRLAPSAASPPGDKAKSPTQNSGTDNTGQAGKKFRPILPRQNLVPISEVVPPKVTAGNVVGTYSAPSGIAVKVHASKKITPPKKSPGAQQQQPQRPTKPISTKSQLTRNTPSPLEGPKPSPATGSTTPVSATKSASNSSNSDFSNSKAIVSKTVSASTPSPPTTSQSTLPTLPNLSSAAIQAAMTAGLSTIPTQLEVAAAADFNKFLKDNLLRAQVQAAAAASQPNLFYPYANATAAAAQLSHHYTPNLYQQAYMFEQLARMQRAEKITEYMQKLRHGLEKPLTPTTEDNSDANSGTASKAASATFTNNSKATPAALGPPPPSPTSLTANQAPSTSAAKPNTPTPTK